MFFAKGLPWMQDPVLRAKSNDSERSIIRGFEDSGIHPQFVDVDPRTLLYYLSGGVYYVGDPALRLGAILILFTSTWSMVRRKNAKTIIEDDVVRSLAIFILCYSLVLSASAAVLSDRYTFINFVVLCLLSARVARLSWDTTVTSDRAAGTDH